MSTIIIEEIILYIQKYKDGINIYSTVISEALCTRICYSIFYHSV